MKEPETLTALAGLVASAFGLVRYAIGMHRTLLDRLVGHLQEVSDRQAEVNRRFQATLDRLAASLAGQARALRRLVGGEDGRWR